MPGINKMSYKGKSMKLGGGGRFAKLAAKVQAQGYSKESAQAVAAAVGRAKYGKKRFQAMAAKGRKQA